MPEKAILQCTPCGATRDTTLTPTGQPRIPSQSGWKRRTDALYCRDCWTKRYRLSAIVLPVRPVDPGEWPALRQALKEVWAQTASLANWTILELVKRDMVRLPGMEKFPTVKPFAIYRYALENYPLWSWWQGQTQAANAILRMAEKRWRKDRYAVLWRNAQAVPSYRYGTPYPLDADAYALSHGDGGQCLINASLAKQRWLLQLQTAHHWPHKAALAKMISGEALAVEAAFYERRQSTGDHRAGRADGEPGGGGQTYRRLYCKLVAWLPRMEQAVKQTAAQPPKTMRLSTGKQVFLSAAVAGSEPWLLHADEPRRWIVEYMLRLGRLSEDMKYERRWPKRQRTKIEAYREQLVSKHQRRIDSWLKQCVHKVVAYASRNRVSEIQYAEEGYLCNPFPWARLKTMLAQKADEFAIAFSLEGGKVVDDASRTAPED
jgi:hypothetical protein